MNECAAAHPEVPFGIMFNQRTNKLYQRVKAIVESGELGQIRRSNWIINSWWRPDSYYRQSDWRATWGGEGGGVSVKPGASSAGSFTVAVWNAISYGGPFKIWFSPQYYSRR